MAEKINSGSTINSKDFYSAFGIFMLIIIIAAILAGVFSPAPLLFSEDFENAERNKQYLPCPAFTIQQDRLRITVDHSFSGCAVALPNEYGDFTFTASLFPVGDVYDGSANILFKQGGDGGYEIQLRPNKQEINFIETVKNSDQESPVIYSTGWMPSPAIKFKNSEKKLY